MTKEMKIRNYLIFALFVLLLGSCSNEEIDKEIVLKIGDVNISRYEFERNKERTLPEKEKDNKKSIANWKVNYIDRCLVLAEAYKQGYDTIKAIQKEVQHVANFMMVQKYGYLWQKTLLPIVNERKEVTPNKIKKRRKRISFDYISCSNLDSLLKIMDKDTVLNNFEEYNELKSKCALYDFMKTGYASSQWPYIPFWEYKEYLYNMEQNNISKLLEVNGVYYYFYINQIEIAQVAKKDQENLQKELQLGIETDLYLEKRNEMIREGNPVVNHESIDSIMAFVSKGKPINEFGQNLELIQYELDNETIKIDFNTFMEYYSYLPVNKDINTKANLLWLVNQYFYDDYLKLEAEKLDLYSTEEFIYDQKVYKNNLLFKKFVDNEIRNKSHVDSSEILEFYEQNKSRFTKPKTITVDLYAFDDPGKASMNFHAISNLLNKNQEERSKDSSIIKGLWEFAPDYKMDMDESDQYPEEFIKEILNLKTGNLSSIPVGFEDKYVLVYKKDEQGQETKSLEEVYDQIFNQIMINKIELKKDKLLKDLRNIHKIEYDNTGI